MKITPRLLSVRLYISVTKIRPSGAFAKKRTRLKPSAAGMISKFAGRFRSKLLPFFSVTFCGTSRGCAYIDTEQTMIRKFAFQKCVAICVNLWRKKYEDRTIPRHGRDEARSGKTSDRFHRRLYR